jgi:translation initiation factor 6 (eIF-6)
MFYFKFKKIKFNKKKSNYIYIKMVNSYVLVNPHIEGNFKSKIKARNSNEAANIFYKNLSEHFNNFVPKFNFSIQKGS